MTSENATFEAMQNDLQIQSEGSQISENVIQSDNNVPFISSNQWKEPNTDFERKVPNYSINVKENLPIQVDRNELPNTKSMFQCKICNRNLSSKFCLKKHYKSKHGMDSFEDPNIPLIAPMNTHMNTNISLRVENL